MSDGEILTRSDHFRPAVMHMFLKQNYAANTHSKLMCAVTDAAIRLQDFQDFDKRVTMI